MARSGDDREGPDPPASVAVSRHVFSRNATVLLELLDRPELTPQHVILLLRNPALPEEGCERLCEEERFLRVYRVRAALAQNPRTPQREALRFLPGLFWKDLLQVARDFRIASGVRHKAEAAILERLKKLAIGEKIELARQATTEILKSLALEGDPRILRACLQNPRATVEIARRVIISEKVQPEFLLSIMQMQRWFDEYDVKLALARAVRSPIRLVLRVLPHLRRDDLAELRRDGTQPKIVIEQVEEILRLKGSVRA